MENSKPWWQSKTLWANAVAIVAIVVQGTVGYVVSPELQAYALVGVNALLRLISSGSLTISA